MMKSDGVIVGGGVMGASIAYHLLADGFPGTLVIVERDPSYEFASTTRSVGGVRQQFSSEVNIRIGLYSVEAYERFDEEMALDGEPAHVQFRQRGYLFLADEGNWATLSAHYRLQRSLGVEVECLSPEEIGSELPHLRTDHLQGGFWGRRAGYLDPHGVLQGYLRKARSLGAEYLHADVVRILREGTRVMGVETRDGRRLLGDWVLLCAGAWSGQLAATAGIHLPVQPVPRMVYCFDPAEKFDYELPLVIAPDGLYFRHESGRQVIAGKARPEEPGFRFQWDRDYFMEDLWPRLARWVPAFECLKLIRGWAGLYAVCTLDENALLGPYPGLEGLYVATGFSGHGLQQAPAVGKGISELILRGRYETLDLSPLGVDRILTGKGQREEGVV